MRLQGLFRDRIIWVNPSTTNYEEDDVYIEDIEDALERMDALADRAQFSLEGTGSTSSSSRYNNSYSRSNSRYNNRYSNNNRSGRYGYSSGYGGMGGYGGGNLSGQLMDDVELDVAPEYVLEQLVESGQGGAGVRTDRPGVVFVSMLRNSNDLMLRTKDSLVMDHILEVIEEMDKPKAQVLIEVKVLEIQLDNEDARGIDWLFKNSDLSGGRSTGLVGDSLTSAYGQILPPDGNLIPKGTGLDSEASLLQAVSNNIVARIQMLETQGKVLRLATPNLCVADGEASRVFVGSETTILTSIDVDLSTSSGDNPITTESIDPETERRNVGHHLADYAENPFR